MKSTFLGILVILGLSISSVFENSMITVGVKGMVCSFCAQGIEKKFKAEPAVEKIHVSLADKEVHLTLKDGQNLEDSKIQSILIDSGYSVEKITRD